MDENAEIDISEYHQTPLASLALPENYAKLIKRIINLNVSLQGEFNLETVGDIVRLEPDQFSNFQGVGKLYVKTLIEFKKELPLFLDKLRLEPNFVIKEEIFSSINNNYDFETPIYRLALSQKYQKLIKRISAVIDHVETVKDIIDIDITSFSKLPAVGKLYVDSLMNLQNALLPCAGSDSIPVRFAYYSFL
jgi:hypothetical protein